MYIYCTCVCTFMCTCIFAYGQYTCIHTHEYMHLCTYIYIHNHSYIIYMYIHNSYSYILYVCSIRYICMCVFMYICTSYFWVMVQYISTVWTLTTKTGFLSRSIRNISKHRTDMDPIHLFGWHQLPPAAHDCWFSRSEARLVYTGQFRSSLSVMISKRTILTLHCKAKANSLLIIQIMETHRFKVCFPFVTLTTLYDGSFAILNCVSTAIDFLHWSGHKPFTMLWSTAYVLLVNSANLIEPSNGTWILS